MKLLLSAVAFIFSLEASAPNPLPRLTPESVKQGFMEGIVVCTVSMAKGVKIADLPQNQRKLVLPGDQSTREQMDVLHKPEIQVWQVASAAGIVSIKEASDRSCQVSAYGSEVDSTFSYVDEVLHTDDFKFSTIELKHDRSHYARKLSRAYKDRYVLIGLNGSNPGQWMHLSKFPVLLGVVSWDELTDADRQWLAEHAQKQ